MKKLFIGMFLLMCIACSSSKEKEIEHYFKSTKDTYLIRSFSFLQENLSKSELDLLVRDKEFMIHDIERAVNTCREQLNKGELPFEIFCEYVLPVQVRGEPVENWREDCQREYAYLKGMRTGYICDQINYRFMNHFKYGDRISDTPRSWSQLKVMETGDCYDMVQAVIYPLRALGTPVTIDFTYGWGNANGMHAWNTVYINGKMQTFMGIERGPDTHDPFRVYHSFDNIENSAYRYPAKVYRKTPIPNKEILSLRKAMNDMHVPDILLDYKVRDVTEEYFQVKDISLAHELSTKKNKVAYLSIYNDNKWQPAVATLVREGKPLVFEKIKTGMLYLPSTYSYSQVRAVDSPLILKENGEIEKLKANDGIKQELTVHFLQPVLLDYLKIQSNSSNYPVNTLIQMGLNNAYRSLPENGDTYILYYWSEEGWKRTGEEIAVDNKIHFTNIPSNALYQLTDQGGIIGRCFTIENGEMKWW